MSLSSALNTPSNLQAYVRSGCLVPFLYQTQTLLSRTPPAQIHRARRCPDTAPRNSSFDSRRLYETSSHERGKSRPKHAYYKNNSSPNRRFNRPSDFELPFEDVASPDEGESRQTIEQSKKSTMTASEKAVFDRILQDIELGAPKQREKEDALGDEQDDGYDPQEDLITIFDAAIRDLREQEERAREGAERSQQIAAKVVRERAVDTLAPRKDEPPGAVVFRRPLKLANGIVLGDEMQTEEDLERLKKACDDHRGLISGMLEHATTDVEIWQILEMEVFKLVGDLNAQIEAREKARKEAEKKTDNPEPDDTKSKKKKKIRPKNRPNVKKATQETVALPTNTLYFILSTNYSDYLLSALRLLRRHHPTSSYALYLFPTIKRLGPISYVLGASTGLYNEILFLRWTQYSDLHGMADLLQEMLDQGIEVNGVTNMLLGRLKKNRMAGLKGRMGPVVHKWWDLSGTDEGWKRIVGLEQVIRREEVEAVARRAGEKEEQREEEREDYERLVRKLMVE